jgi:hypothetical protein
LFERGKDVLSGWAWNGHSCNTYIYVYRGYDPGGDAGWWQTFAKNQQVSQNEQLSNDEEAKALAESYGAVSLLDKMNLYHEMIPAIMQCSNTQHFSASA